ncbi:MAG: carboxy-S-adenosyl-L-methionine synthase CmoA [Helicobacteraceae bacterium]|jgi:tRNA (cmo5U34)-methyltransferase|nr:carboxy-S-adenosyl-L-methionine synthase CmoA [Helicobacteraceae bacterium]
MRDTHFSTPQGKQFEFDRAVAGVFDDMLARSVPFYDESLETTADLICRFVDGEGAVLDLGCSTGTLLLKIRKKAGGRLKLVGLDTSEAMIEQAKRKAKAFGAEIDFKCMDVLAGCYENLAAVCAGYLLQFIRPPKRLELVKNIYSWLNNDGIFIFSEKLISHHKKLDKILIDRYIDFKRKMGYSDYEISAKREALENVLIPYAENENREMIKSAGFSHFESVLRYNNFATFIAIK